MRHNCNLYFVPVIVVAIKSKGGETCRTHSAHGNDGKCIQNCEEFSRNGLRKWYSSGLL
jgi:hypothetical protein